MYCSWITFFCITTPQSPTKRTQPNIKAELYHIFISIDDDNYHNSTLKPFGAIADMVGWVEEGNPTLIKDI